MKESIQNVKKLNGAPILFVGSKHFGGLNSELMNLPADQLFAMRHKTPTETLDLNEEIRKAVGDKRFIDVQMILCGDPRECAYFNGQGLLVSYDGVHLTPDGAQILGALLSHDARFENLFN